VKDFRVLNSMDIEKLKLPENELRTIDQGLYSLLNSKEKNEKGSACKDCNSCPGFSPSPLLSTDCKHCGHVWNRHTK